MVYAEDCKSFYIGSIPVPASLWAYVGTEQVAVSAITSILPVFSIS